MKVKSSSILRTSIGIIIVNLITFYASGQNEDSTQFLLPSNTASPSLAPDIFLFKTKNAQFNDLRFLTPNHHQQNRLSANDWLLSKPKIKQPKIKPEQNKIENIFPNLGQSNQFSGNLNYQLPGKLKIDLGMGLYQQNTILTPWAINYQLGANSTMEYSFNSWLSAYVYGQYISPSLTQNKFFDPLQYMNPLFKQTEFGGGLRAKYKGIKADVGVKKMMGSDLDETRSIGYFQSKISVGF